VLLTVAQAAKRVKRSRRTIERWMADKTDPLPVQWWSNIRMVNIDDLLRVYRARLMQAHPHLTSEQVERHLIGKYLPIRSTHRRD